MSIAEVFNHGIWQVNAGARRSARNKQRRTARMRLENLRNFAGRSAAQREAAASNGALDSVCLDALQDRLGRAGWITKRERQAAKLVGGSVVLSGIIAGSACGAVKSLPFIALGAVCGGYLGVLCWMGVLRVRAVKSEREILFELPLFLESVILLVEAGLGVLPALQRVVVSRSRRRGTLLHKLFDLVYGLTAAGMPFSEALKTVADRVEIPALRHTLLHLDITGSEGGELIPAMRSLSDHGHSEWKLSVENRLRRLENLVVFPVFAAVLGLMCLAVAVPVVPVLDFFAAAQQNKQSTAMVNNLQNAPAVFGR